MKKTLDIESDKLDSSIAEDLLERIAGKELKAYLTTYATHMDYKAGGIKEWHFKDNSYIQKTKGRDVLKVLVGAKGSMPHTITYHLKGKKIEKATDNTGT